MTEDEIRRIMNHKVWKKNQSYHSLSKKVGVSPQSVYNWFYDIADTRLSMVMAMCEALDLELVVREKVKE